MNRFGAFSFGDYAAQTVKAAGGASVIKHIEQGTITIGASSASGTWSPGSSYACVTANTILIWNGINTTNTSATTEDRDACTIVLTNTTTVTATRGLAPATFTLTVNFTLVEFASGVNSIQAGNIVVTHASGATGTATLSPGMGANAFVLFQGWSEGTSAQGTASVTLTNTTTVTATVFASATIDQTVRFMAVDLDTTIVSGVQQKAVSITSSSASDTDTLSAVTAGNTLLMWGGVNAQAVEANAFDCYSTFLTNTTTVTKTRTGSGAAARTINYTAVSFAADALNGSVQRSSSLALSSQTSNTSSLTTIDTTKSFVNWNGFSAAAGNPNVTAPALTLQASTVTGAISSAGSATIPYEVIQFA